MRAMDEAEILATVEAFEQATLPMDAWTHAAHLTTALVYVRRHGRDGALARMREGLVRYVTAATGNAAPYHETLTRAWIEVVARFDAAHANEPLAHVAQALVARCGDKLYLQRHYTRDLLMNDEARARWVPPDREPIE